MSLVPYGRLVWQCLIPNDRVGITFKVNHGIISGVRYIHVVKRAGIRGKSQIHKSGVNRMSDKCCGDSGQAGTDAGFVCAQP